MLYVCGFNGFGQWSGIMGEETTKETSFKKFVKVKDYGEDLELSISWCNVLVMSEGRILIGGFTNGKENLLEVTLPEEMKHISFVKGVCSRLKCSLLSDIGECWEFDFPSKCWLNISQLQFPSTALHLVDLRSADTITLALSNSGVVYRGGEALDVGARRVKEIDCGREHGIILTEDGTVYTIGGASRGQLGGGSLVGTNEVCEVEALSGLYVVAISAGGWHNCAITKSGALYTWGWNRHGQLATPNDSSCVVFAEPQLVEWPSDARGTPTQVSCGTSHTVVKLSDGSIWGCGWNKWGQLGSEEFDSTSVMRRLQLPDSSVKVLRVVCGSWSTALISP